MCKVIFDVRSENKQGRVKRPRVVKSSVPAERRMWREQTSRRKEPGHRGYTPAVSLWTREEGADSGCAEGWWGRESDEPESALMNADWLIKVALVEIRVASAPWCYETRSGTPINYDKTMSKYPEPPARESLLNSGERWWSKQSYSVRNRVGGFATLENQPGSRLKTGLSTMIPPNHPVKTGKSNQIVSNQVLTRVLGEWVKWPGGRVTKTRSECIYKIRLAKGNHRDVLHKYYAALTAYKNRNATSLRERARLRMQRRRAEAKKSEEENKRAQERRRKWDAEYREYGPQSTPPVRPSLARKFLQNLMPSRRYKKKYGAKKCLKCYFLLVMKHDGDLTGVQVPTGEDDEEFSDEKAQGRGIAVDRTHAMQGKVAGKSKDDNASKTQSRSFKAGLQFMLNARPSGVALGTGREVGRFGFLGLRVGPFPVPAAARPRTPS
ncbi:hypothetical protein B0H13DRAFT_1891695 [Mycena leptocephala]|nr:hypothetical protein B0H13DRAFT_1891695 [Mycena leptocephala]